MFPLFQVVASHRLATVGSIFDLAAVGLATTGTRRSGRSGQRAWHRMVQHDPTGDISQAAVVSATSATIWLFNIAMENHHF